MQDMLASHCIPFSRLSYNLRYQALCHHLVNGLCARSSGSLCILVLGGLPPSLFALLVGKKILEVVSDPLFLLQILQQITLGLRFHSSGDQERSDSLSSFRAHNHRLSALSHEKPSNFFLGLETASKAHLLA
jgi:hypothetical protein